MVYVAHTRMVVGGGLGNVVPRVEEWSCTLNFSGTDFQFQAAVDSAWGEWDTLITSGLFTDAVNLEYVKCSAIDISGHVVGAVLRHDQHSEGGATAVYLPPQCATVVSLRTGERGPSKRGRFYLPPTNTGCEGDDFLMPDLFRDAVETAAVTLLTALNALAVGGALVVASSKGYNTEVTGINVGRAFDTQRRRRRDLSEDYQIPVAI